MSMRALDQPNSLGDTLEPWNSGVTIAETDCWISTTDLKAKNEVGACVISLDFSNLPIKKTSRLSTAGGRSPVEPGVWLATAVRLTTALREEALGIDVCHSAAISRDSFFVLHLEVDPSRVSEVMVTLAEYLDKFGLNCGIVHT
jgi:hypothetical protein